METAHTLLELFCDILHQTEKEILGALTGTEKSLKGMIKKEYNRAFKIFNSFQINILDKQSTDIFQDALSQGAVL